MLYQPTNITPDARGALGNGTVDITEDLTVTWQVNGNSAMTAYKIVIYQNDTGSTQVLDTGKLTTNCPFYGVTAAGVQQTFSHTITAASLSSAGMTNGSSYKLIITQWWSENDNVVQTGAAAFITRAAPVVTLTNLPQTTDRRVIDVNASYTQAQGDALNWVRWQAALDGETDNPFLDTGNIYGTALLTTTIDGLFDGNTYAVKCSVQTESGVEADTGWQTFDVSYPTAVFRGTVEVSQAAGANALHVKWSRATYYPSQFYGGDGYETGDGYLLLDTGTSVMWQLDLDRIPAPWTFVYSGYLLNADATLFHLYLNPNEVVCTYDADDRTVRVTFDGSTVLAIENVPGDAGILVAFGPETVRATVIHHTDGIYPANTQTPDEELYPSWGETDAAGVYTASISYTQGPLVVFSLSGRQRTEYVWITEGNEDEEDIQTILSGADYTPYWGFETLFLADFDEGSTEGGSVADYSDAGNLDGYHLYRKENGSTGIEKVGYFDFDTREVIDYAARNGTAYVYYVFPADSENYPLSPIQSVCTRNCNWNWTVLSCSQRTDGSYAVNAAFDFGKNLATGGISNNSNPGVLENFTRYPIIQPNTALYLTGTLESLIGVIDPDTGEYTDTRSVRDAIYALSISDDIMFLKSRKGDFFEVRPSSEISMTTMDNTTMQAQRVSLPWAQTGSGEGVQVWMLSTS